MDAGVRPLARKENLIVEELGDELLVYDLTSDKVHCLTPLAAQVWRACDGADRAALSARLTLSDDEVERAVSELDQSGLLASAPSTNGASNGGMSRRDFGLRISKVAAATASLPLVLTIPAPAIAQSSTLEEFCEAIPASNGCGNCNDGGTAGGTCCCCNPGGGSLKRCAASQAHCDELLPGANCTEVDPRLANPETEDQTLGNNTQAPSTQSVNPNDPAAPTTPGTAPAEPPPTPTEPAPAAAPVETAPPPVEPAVTTPVEPTTTTTTPVEPVAPSGTETVPTP